MFLMLTSYAAVGVLDVRADDGVGATLSFGSDYVFRGISQTLGDPVVQASVDASFPSGFYAYVWASNVDFVPAWEPDDGAELEIDVAIGLSTELTKTWSVDAMLVRYMFPDTVGGIDYDYNELLATFWFNEQYSTTVAYSDDVFASGAKGLLYSLGAHYQLPADVSLAFGYGHYDLSDAYEASYSYLDVGLSRSLGDVAATLAYHVTFGDAGPIFYEQVTGSRYVLSLDIDF